MSDTTPLLNANSHIIYDPTAIEDDNGLQFISIESLIDEHAKPWNRLHPFHSGLLPQQLVLSDAQSIALLIVVNASILINEPSSSQNSLYNQPFARDIRTRNAQIYAILHQLFEQWHTELLTDPKSQNPEEILTLAFRRYDSQSTSIRVLDCLKSAKLSRVLVDHPVLLTTLLRMWSYDMNKFDSIKWYWPQRALRVATSPRARHAFALSFYAVYLTAMVSATASEANISLFSWIWVLLYSFTSIVNNLSLSSTPFILVFIRFVGITIWPNSFTGSPATLLYVALVLHLIQLHTVIDPAVPSLLLLVKPSTSLPLVAFFERLWARAFLPAVALFLPVFFISAVLVSSSMQDPTIPPFSTPVIQVPLDTRYFYFAIFCFSFLMMIALANGLVQSGSFSSDDPTASEWDRCGTGAGLKARLHFARSVAHWTKPSSAFPPPLNIIWWTFVVLPRSVASLWKRQPSRILESLEIVLLSLTIPFTLVLSVVWGWR